MVFILDTNVVSEFRREKPHGAVVAWLRRTPDHEISISAATIGEIQIGIEKSRDSDPTRAQELNDWLDDVARTFNIVPVEADDFRCWGRFMHGRPQHLAIDAMIAATAKVRGLTVVTRNTKDFEPFDVPTVDPFAE